MRSSQGRDVLPEVGAVVRVQPGGRLVENKELGGLHEPHGDIETAALAPGEVGHLGPLLAGEVQTVHELLRPGARGTPAHAEHHTLGHQLVQGPLAVARAVALAHVAEPSSDLGRVGADVEARDTGSTRGRGCEGAEHAHRRRLARAVGAEDRDGLSAPDSEVDTAHRVHRLLAVDDEVLRQPGRADHVSHHGVHRRTGNGQILSAFSGNIVVVRIDSPEERPS